MRTHSVKTRITGKQHLLGADFKHVLFTSSSRTWNNLSHPAVTTFPSVEKLAINSSSILKECQVTAKLTILIPLSFFSSAEQSRANCLCSFFFLVLSARGLPSVNNKITSDTSFRWFKGFFLVKVFKKDAQLIQKRFSSEILKHGL